jgi:hypothetical protein
MIWPLLFWQDYFILISVTRSLITFKNICSLPKFVFFIYKPVYVYRIRFVNIYLPCKPAAIGMS